MSMGNVRRRVVLPREIVRWALAAGLLLTVSGCDMLSSTAQWGVGSAAESGSYQMPRIQGAKAVLPPELWRNAAFTGALVGPLAEPGKARVEASACWTTRAKLAWDPQHLYVLIESIGPAPRSPFTKHDELLHQADAVEIFLDVEGEHRQIVEIQVSPNGTTADYYHVWSEAPSYPADKLDDDFYHAHHRADLNWNLEGLRVQSSVEAAAENRTRWTVMMALPLAEPLRLAGLAPELRKGQKIRANILRYAYKDENGQHVLNHYNLVPVRGGRPHQSPMATAALVAAD